MQDLLHATRQMTLRELEMYFAARFADGEIKEMKHEFDNMARAQERANSLDTTEERQRPGASFLAAGLLEELILRIERTSHRTVDPVAIQKALAVLIGCRGGNSRAETMRSFSLVIAP
jgi:hypothetical protein